MGEASFHSRGSVLAPTGLLTWRLPNSLYDTTLPGTCTQTVLLPNQPFPRSSPAFSIPKPLRRPDGQSKELCGQPSRRILKASTQVLVSGEVQNPQHAQGCEGSIYKAGPNPGPEIHIVSGRERVQEGGGGARQERGHVLLAKPRGRG